MVFCFNFYYPFLFHFARSSSLFSLINSSKISFKSLIIIWNSIFILNYARLFRVVRLFYLLLNNLQVYQYNQLLEISNQLNPSFLIVSVLILFLCFSFLIINGFCSHRYTSVSPERLPVLATVGISPNPRDFVANRTRHESNMLAPVHKGVLTLLSYYFGSCALSQSFLGVKSFGACEINVKTTHGLTKPLTYRRRRDLNPLFSNICLHFKGRMLVSFKDCRTRLNILRPLVYY